MYVFNLFDYQSGGVSLLFIASVEVITIGWFYGSERLRHQVSQMIGYYPNPWWSICWRFVTPTILLTIFIFTLVNWGGVSYNDKKYPAWAEFIGWCFALSSMLMIPIMMIVTLWKTNGDSFMEVRR